MLELNSSEVLLEMSSARSVKQQTSDFILILIMSSSIKCPPVIWAMPPVTSLHIRSFLYIMKKNKSHS